jgi:hypothetical protein
MASMSAIGIWSARNASPGNDKVSALKAGSASLLARLAAMASIKAGSTVKVSPRRQRGIMSSRTEVAYCWPDSHRTKGSVSCAARNRRRSGETPDSFTGAEKPRSKDGIGGLPISSKINSLSAASANNTRVAISCPLPSSSPIASGTTKGCLSG